MNENNKETDDNINNEGVSTSGNYNEEMMMNNNEVTVDKVSNSVNYNDVNNGEIIMNNGDVIENEVSKYNTVSNNSGDDESRKLVEVRGVLVSVIGRY